MKSFQKFNSKSCSQSVVVVVAAVVVVAVDVVASGCLFSSEEISNL